MDFQTVVKERRSVRKYLEKAVPDSLINKALELSLLSPSAKNIQARSVVIVNSKLKIENIVDKAIGQDWIKTAPVVVVVFANLDENSYERAFTDAVIFASYFQLCLTDLGLSSCWVGGFNTENLVKTLKLPADRQPVAIITVGYQSETPETKIRKNLDDLIIKQVNTSRI